MEDPSLKSDPTCKSVRPQAFKCIILEPYIVLVMPCYAMLHHAMICYARPPCVHQLISPPLPEITSIKLFFIVYDQHCTMGGNNFISVLLMKQFLSVDISGLLCMNSSFRSMDCSLDSDLAIQEYKSLDEALNTLFFV